MGRVVLIAVITCFLTGCGQLTQNASKFSTVEEQLAGYELTVSDLKIVGQKSKDETVYPSRSKTTFKTVGVLKNQSRFTYEKVSLLVHVYNADGARLQQQVIEFVNVWPNEKFPINKEFWPDGVTSWDSNDKVMQPAKTALKNVLVIRR